MKVSVIVRAYNRGYVIRQAIESALAQTYPAIEIVIVDDGSTDNTPEIVSNLAHSNVRYVRHEKNRGAGAACNTGIACASGELIAILDSDDLWMPDKLETQVRVLVGNPGIDVVFCDVKIVVDGTEVPSTTRLMEAFPVTLPPRSCGTIYRLSAREMYFSLLEEVSIKTNAVLMRRQAIIRAGPFSEARSGEDWEFFLRLARNSQFAYIDEVLATQRVMKDSTNKQYRDEDKTFLIEVFKREKVRVAVDQNAVAAINRGLSIILGALAVAT